MNDSRVTPEARVCEVAAKGLWQRLAEGTPGEGRQMSRADMLRTLRRRRFAMLFGLAAILMVALGAASVWAADLALPTDEKILEALKAKRLTRCPQVSTRPRCGGAQLQRPPLKSADVHHS
jgi:hypothetical protein